MEVKQCLNIVLLTKKVKLGLVRFDILKYFRNAEVFERLKPKKS